MQLAEAPASVILPNSVLGMYVRRARRAWVRSGDGENMHGWMLLYGTRAERGGRGGGLDDMLLKVCPV